MFERFELEFVELGDITLRVRHGGSGPPVVLLHGHPRTHTTWHRVAPLVAAQHTVVCPDLRGYGESSKPEPTTDHSAHSDRTMARDIVDLMEHLGHERFAVAGHDRGCGVAFRAAMDHPERITRLCVLDGIPIGEALGRMGAKFATDWWHWFFFGQMKHPAERYISLDPDDWYGGDADKMGRENYEDYRRAIHNPETVRAMMEDYRAGLTVDREADDEDRAAGRKLGCPTLFLWSTKDDLCEVHDDPEAIWREWADDVTVVPIESGHHMAEENPEAVAQALLNFLGRA
jgi:haloacetate dehalogenase